MIPLRDRNPSYTLPFVNYFLIAANIAVFLFELSLGENLDPFFDRFAVVPVKLVGGFVRYEFTPFLVFPVLTSMFLHGGWMHIIGNMLFLHIFGDNVEDKLGHVRYFFFYLLGGIAASLTQIFINPASQIPMVGASGAIAGVLGAYVFMFPRAKVLTLIPIFFFFQLVELPAALFLGLWFLLQILSGVLALGIGGDAGGVAWWAHIGGFACGAVLMPFMRKRR